MESRRQSVYGLPVNDLRVKERVARTAGGVGADRRLSRFGTEPSVFVSQCVRIFGLGSYVHASNCLLSLVKVFAGDSAEG